MAGYRDDGLRDRRHGPLRYAAEVTSDQSSLQRWRTLVLVYPVLDARYGSGLSRKRARRVMGREERDVIMGVIDRLPATILDWSSGLATLDPVDVIEVRRPVTSLSSSGGGRWWVGPREVHPELGEVHATGGDTTRSTRYGRASRASRSAAGAARKVPSDATLGAGFSSISTDHWHTLATDPDPEQGYVHEWLHQVEGRLPRAWTG